MKLTIVLSTSLSSFVHSENDGISCQMEGYMIAFMYISLEIFFKTCSMEIVFIFNFHHIPIAFPFYIHGMEMEISIDIEFPYYF